MAGLSIEEIVALKYLHPGTDPGVDGVAHLGIL